MVSGWCCLRMGPRKDQHRSSRFWSTMRSRW
jgi:hypothetical protein